MQEFIFPSIVCIRTARSALNEFTTRLPLSIAVEECLEAAKLLNLEDDTNYSDECLAELADVLLTSSQVVLYTRPTTLFSTTRVATNANCTNPREIQQVFLSLALGIMKLERNQITLKDLYQLSMEAIAVIAFIDSSNSRFSMIFRTKQQKLQRYLDQTRIVY